MSDARFARLETPRLVCEPIRVEHAAAMLPVLSDPRLYAHLPGAPPESLEALERRYARLAAARSPDGSELWLNWILLARGSGAALGFTQATLAPAGCSIGYVLGVAHQRCGLASEAVAAMVSQLFEAYALPSLQAEIAFANLASARLARRLGFVLARKDLAAGDDVYELTREAWAARAAR